MSRKISLGLVGVIVAPAVLAAFVIGLVIAGVLNITPRPADAQSGSLAQVGASLTAVEHSPFVQVSDMVLPAVVNISAEKTVRTVRRFGDSEPGSPLEEMFRDFFKGIPEMPFEQQRSALGSGVIISPEGYIVTNNHVVSGFDKLTVKLADETEYKGKEVKVVGRDPKTDLAVLKVESKKDLPTLKLADASGIKVGDWAVAVGNPFGLSGTVTVGVVSAKGRTNIPLPEGPTYQDFIQTDASINPGNSGGALVNIKGELIGINSAIRSPVGVNVGVGFAVPVDLVKSVTDQLIKGGKVVRGYMGIRPQPVDDALRNAMGLDDTRGVLVAEVVTDAPAEKAGLKAGDVIIKVNGVKTDGVEQFRRHVAEFPPGSNVAVTVVREGETMTKQVKLVEYPEDEAQASAPAEEMPTPWLGLSVRSMTGEERQQAGVSQGVVVSEVESGSAAGEAGIRRGDIILEVGATRIEGTADFNRAAKERKGSSKAVRFRVKRGDTMMFIGVEPSD